MWKKIRINKNQIIADTGRAVLIALPHKSKYNGYSFWYPLKLIRDGKSLMLLCKDNSDFTIKKYDKSNQILDEIVLDSDEIEEIYGAVKDCFETHKPENLMAEDTQADESLIDYE